MVVFKSDGTHDYVLALALSNRLQIIRAKTKFAVHLGTWDSYKENTRDVWIQHVNQKYKADTSGQSWRLEKKVLHRHAGFREYFFSFILECCKIFKF